MFFRRDMSPHDARQTIAIGDSDGRESQLSRSLHEFIRMRGTFEEREVRPTMQLGIPRRRQREWCRCGGYRKSFARRLIGHLEQSLNGKPQA